MPKYIVTDSAGMDRLIEAAAPANAIAFCAKDSFTAERVSDKVAALTKLPIEKVTAEKPESEPAGDPPALGTTSKRKASAPTDADLVG